MTENTKKCPYCGEEILAVAIKCKHCGEKLISSDGSVLTIETSKKLKIVKDTLLSSDSHWKIRSEDENTLHLEYKEEAEKAGCGTGCILAIINLPIAIIYAILGGKNVSSSEVTIKIENDKIRLFGNVQKASIVYNKLISNSEIRDSIEKTNVIETTEKSKKVLLIFFLIIIALIIIMNLLQKWLHW